MPHLAKVTSGAVPHLAAGKLLVLVRGVRKLQCAECERPENFAFTNVSGRISIPCIPVKPISVGSALRVA